MLATEKESERMARTKTTRKLEIIKARFNGQGTIPRRREGGGMG